MAINNISIYITLLGVYKALSHHLQNSIQQSSKEGQEDSHPVADEIRIKPHTLFNKHYSLKAVIEVKLCLLKTQGRNCCETYDHIHICTSVLNKFKKIIKQTPSYNNKFGTVALHVCL